MDLESYRERKKELGLDKPIEFLIEQATKHGILENDNCTAGEKFYKLDKSYRSIIDSNLEDIVKLTAFKAYEPVIRCKEFVKYSIVFLMRLFQEKESQLALTAKKMELGDTAELYVGLAAYAEKKAKDKNFLSQPAADLLKFEITLSK